MPPSRSSLIGAHHPDVGKEFGSYKVISVVGEGGMGVVYMAEHMLLGRKVAIKKLKDRLSARPDSVQRFFEEARTVNRIKHPNIVEITDFVSEDGSAYYVMELLEGQTVAKALRIEGVLSARRALHICFQVANALAAAHQEGIVHADIKPSNIFLTEQGGQPDFVKLLDFGVAQLVSSEPDDPTAAPPVATSLGTPVYMSPEQARGEAMDHRSDLYSLGAVLYEMLSGRPPFTAESTPEYLYKHMNVRPKTLARIKDVPQPIATAPSRVVMRCLEKDPEARFQTAGELKDQLEKAARTTGIILRVGSTPSIEVPRIRIRRKATMAAIGILAAVAVAVGVGVVVSKLGSKSGSTAKSANPPPAEPRKDKPAPKRILLSIDTAPQGAEVLRAGPKEELLGLTPLRLRFTASKERWTLTVRMEGYHSKTVQVGLSGDQTISLELKPKKDSKKAAPDSSARGTDTRKVKSRAGRRPRKGSRTRRTRPRPMKPKPRHLLDPFEK